MRRPFLRRPYDASTRHALLSLFRRLDHPPRRSHACGTHRRRDPLTADPGRCGRRRRSTPVSDFRLWRPGPDGLRGGLGGVGRSVHPNSDIRACPASRARRQGCRQRFSGVSAGRRRSDTGRKPGMNPIAGGALVAAPKNACYQARGFGQGGFPSPWSRRAFPSAFKLLPRREGSFSAAFRTHRADNLSGGRFQDFECGRAVR